MNRKEGLALDAHKGSAGRQKAPPAVGLSGRCAPSSRTLCCSGVKLPNFANREQSSAVIPLAMHVGSPVLQQKGKGTVIPQINTLALYIGMALLCSTFFRCIASAGI